MNKLRTLIIDDELNGIENLSHILNEFCPKIEVVGTTQSLKEAEEKINLLNPHLVFLDVQIGTKTVFDLLKKLKKISFEIIFVSAYNHAIKAYKFRAVDYLLKPIDIKSLKQAIDRAAYHIENKYFQDQTKELMTELKSSNQKNKKIAIPTSDGYEFVDINEILYCIADGSYTKLHLKCNKKLVASQTLKYYQDILTTNFLRVHNSNLINMKYIKKVSRSDGGYLTMEDGKTLSISRAKKGILFEKLNLL